MKENKIIKLPSGGEAIIRGFVTIRDRQKVNAIIFGDKEADEQDVASGKIKVKFVNLLESVEEQIKLLIISFNGNSENPYEALMECTNEEDYNAVRDAVTELFGDHNNKKK